MVMRIRRPSAVGLGILIVFTLWITAESSHGGTLDISWNAPTTNADGTPLIDLADYRLYVETPCPGTSYRRVPSPTTSPQPGTVLTYAAGGLLAGTSYVAQITAVDQAGNESQCSSPASGVAHMSFTVSPTGGVAFGSVPVGGFADQTFTVQNIGLATLSGTAAARSPFSVVSGASFSVAPGGTKAVVVRFQPTVAGDVAANLTVSADRDSVSRGVSGTGTVTSTATLTVTRSGSGTVTSSPAGISCGTTCAAAFPPGTTVVLAALAASGSTFAGWGGACAGTAACTVTLNSSLSVSATFLASTNPAPTLSTLAPASVVAGGAGFTLTVNGASFVSSSVVHWNGTARATTYVSASQLRAAIAAGDVAVAGTAAVTVVTPAPGGGLSAGLAFTITSAVASEIVVDNAAAGVQDPAGGRTFKGTWCRSSAPNPFGVDSLYSCARKRNVYRWTPNIPTAGTYDVYIWITPERSRSTAVPHTVSHVGGSTTRLFNHTTGGGTWILHGRYPFNAGTVGYVEVTDRKGEVGADAVRFVRVP